MDFSASVFETKPAIEIPEDAQVIWINDMFVEDYVGGAELTSEALIASSPFEVFKVHSKDVTMDLLERGFEKYWVFGNFAAMDAKLIPSIVANLKYSIVEYDYKYCRYRSPEKHMEAERKPCNCQNEMQGKMISALYYGAQSLWWMSEKQQERFYSMFPFLAEKKNTVLSSVFDEPTFATIKALRHKHKDTERKGWIVLGSTSWIKGCQDAKDYCERNDHDYEVVWDVPYIELLEKLVQAEGFVYLPKGGDTCPRMVIEAKLLGCELVLNDNVQHKDEEWFLGVEIKAENYKDDADEITRIEQYLFACREIFWNGITEDMSFLASLSGYTTTKDCISQGYPYEAAITSMLAFCDEVVVVDGGSTDGTWERLEALASDEPKLKVHQERRDWDSERFAVFDGLQKAKARELCTSDFCWQQDSDEVVHENDAPLVRELLKFFPHNVDLLALPVIEYWGGQEKVRCDVFPWKWRLSRNRPNITHGIPEHLRKYDDKGELYAQQGTDGCDYIHKGSNTLVPFANFYTVDVEMLRRSAQDNDEHLKMYEQWFNAAVGKLPSVFHFSWYDIERKIKTYRDYWGKHWKSLYDIEIEDTVETNMMFDAPWSEVNDEMITHRAKVFREMMGGWIFHSKWDGTPTKHITCERELPGYIEEWIKRTE